MELTKIERDLLERASVRCLVVHRNHVVHLTFGLAMYIIDGGA